MTVKQKPALNQPTNQPSSQPPRMSLLECKWCDDKGLQRLIIRHDEQGEVDGLLS
jgi:hypothetical protein